MKKTLLLLSAMAIGASAYADTFDCVADTWIRENNTSWKGATAKTIETQRVDVIDETTKEVVGKADFVGLFGFNFTVPQGQKVQSATLHLVTERRKGHDVHLYGYSNNFSESDACWDTEASYIEAAYENDPVAVFTAAGQGNKAIFDEGIGEDNQSLAAWTNDIDVTNYLKSLPTTATRANFLVMQDGGQVCFYSKDNGGQDKAFANTDAQTSFTAAELLPYLEVTFTEDSDSSTEYLLPTDDTLVRSNAADKLWHTNTEIEIYNYTDENENDITFVGLMKFALPGEVLSDNYDLTGASLRLVTTQIKGDRNVNIHAYTTSFVEATTWNEQADNVAEALATDPVASFTAAGQGNKNILADELSEDFVTADAWTNVIDLTDYVKSLVDSNVGQLSLLFTKDMAQNNALKFATKEMDAGETLVNKTVDTLTFDPKDLVPVLTVSYTKNSSGALVSVEAVDANAPVEYYNLQGIRVVNPERGNFYIQRQGNVAKKIIF